MFNEKAYVLTERQLSEAVLRGAIEMGLIDGDDPGAESSLREFAEGEASTLDLTVAANGAVLTFGYEEHLPVRKVAAEPLELDEEKFLEPEKGTVSEEPAKVEEGPAPEDVKGLLVQVMERAPSIATVRKWSVSERKKAKAWARKVLKLREAAMSSDGEGVPERLPERPDFIHEPAPRGSKDQVPKGRRQAAPAEPSNGVAASARISDFFEGGEEEAPEA